MMTRSSRGARVGRLRAHVWLEKGADASVVTSAIPCPGRRWPLRTGANRGSAAVMPGVGWPKYLKSRDGTGTKCRETQQSKCAECGGKPRQGCQSVGNHHDTPVSCTITVRQLCHGAGLHHDVRVVVQSYSVTGLSWCGCSGAITTQGKSPGWSATQGGCLPLARFLHDRGILSPCLDSFISVDLWGLWEGTGTKGPTQVGPT